MVGNKIGTITYDSKYVFILFKYLYTNFFILTLFYLVIVTICLHDESSSNRISQSTFNLLTKMIPFHLFIQHMATNDKLYFL